MSDFKRIGVAICHPINGRSSEYGIYALEEAYGIPLTMPRLYIKYEGYREGDVAVGLPLAGVNAAHRQPLLDFDPRNPSWRTIHYFVSGPWNS